MQGDMSAVLALPYLQPAQAQKHVTHNEALRILDALVQLAVASRSAATPPAAPAPGLRHIVPAGGTGAFAGQAGRIALWEGQAWAFFDPAPGWQGWIADEAAVAVYDGSAWRTPAEGGIAMLGIAASADATNRLAVAAPATLLTHAGAGHQLKINKAAAAETASLLFQTGWSARAEMGTAGSDDFAIKTSADGSAFQTALSADAGSGRVTLPAGALVAGGAAAAPGLGFAGDADTGIARIAADVLALVAGGAERARVDAAGLSAPNLLRGTSQVFSRDNILGSVGLAGGIPTGAVIETGSNAAGRWLRLADGTQICDHLIDEAASAWATANGALFARAAAIGWTYPAAFAAPPRLVAAARHGDAVLTGVSQGAVTATAAALRPFASQAVAAGAAKSLALVAIGTWI